MEQWPGKAYPLGATYDGSGTNFAIFSEVAEKVELCLFDADGAEIQSAAERGRMDSSGTAFCRQSNRVSATAIGCTGPTTRPPGIGATRTSC